MVHVILDTRNYYCSFTASEVLDLTNSQLWRKCQTMNGADCLLGKGRFDELIEAARILVKVSSIDELKFALSTCEYAIAPKGNYECMLHLNITKSPFGAFVFKVNRYANTHDVELIFE